MDLEYTQQWLEASRNYDDANEIDALYLNCGVDTIPKYPRKTCIICFGIFFFAQSCRYLL